jgi:succinate dehydrogenase/fumarate reductase flavoprotein subunit
VHFLILAAGGYTGSIVSSSRTLKTTEKDGSAYEAGADLVEWKWSSSIPQEWFGQKRLGTLATEAMRGEGGILNSKDERFMKNMILREWARRDVARANYNEIVLAERTRGVC